MKLNHIACIVFLAVSVQCLEEYIEDSDRFPGWRGELPSLLHSPHGTHHDTLSVTEQGEELWTGTVEQISWKPRAFIFHQFLTDEECDHLKQLAAKSLHKSTVVDSTTGKSVDSEVRTSSGTFLSYGQDEIVTRIEQRLAHVTMIPEVNGESIQILKYVNGQKYEPHTDYFHDKFNADPAHGGQRVATVLMYLATPEEGGETVFPYADEKVSGPGWSDCALKGLAVKAIKGNAIFFYGLKADGSDDPSSTHGSCPTTKGEKWSATKWLHVSSFKKTAASSSVCEDTHKMCEKWAGSGECDKNPVYMEDHCRKACDKCSPTATGVLGRKSVITAK